MGRRRRTNQAPFDCTPSQFLEAGTRESSTAFHSKWMHSWVTHGYAVQTGPDYVAGLWVPLQQVDILGAGGQDSGDSGLFLNGHPFKRLELVL